jgi:hypothetical protein
LNVVIKTDFHQANIPVFCDVCKIIVKYIKPAEWLELTVQDGWQGDMLCGDCWDNVNWYQNAVPEALQGDFLGFVEIVDETPWIGAQRGDFELLVTNLRHVIVKVARPE